jgi:hypothetical protein
MFDEMRRQQECRDDERQRRRRRHQPIKITTHSDKSYPSWSWCLPGCCRCYRQSSWAWWRLLVGQVEARDVLNAVDANFVTPPRSNSESKRYAR